MKDQPEEAESPPVLGDQFQILDDNDTNCDVIEMSGEMEPEKLESRFNISHIYNKDTMAHKDLNQQFPLKISELDMKFILQKEMKLRLDRNRVQRLKMDDLCCNFSSDEDQEMLDDDDDDDDEQIFSNEVSENQLKLGNEMSSRKPSVHIKPEKQISYTQLKSTIAQNHPADDAGNRYSWKSYLGSFSCFQMKDADGDDLVPISDAQKDLGLGPCLMLMTSKSIAYLFLILSIINIPLYMCYDIDDNQASSGSALNNLFFKYSIGSIGSEHPMCVVETINANKNEYGDLTFSCDDGKMAGLSMLGLPLESQVNCTAVEANHEAVAWKSFMLRGCNYNDGLFLDDKAQEQMEKDFEQNCLKQENCTIKFTDYRQHLSEKCKKKDQERREAGQSTLLGSAFCISNKVKMPFDMVADVYLYKQDLAYFVIFIDVICIISVIIFIVVIKERQNHFIKAFKVKTIQMDDYSIRIGDLPPLETYAGDRDVLKAHLWNHFYNVFENETKDEQNAGDKEFDSQVEHHEGGEQQVLHDIDEVEMQAEVTKINGFNDQEQEKSINFSDIQVSGEKNQEDKDAEERRLILKETYEIVDITFAETNNFETDTLMSMYPLHHAIKDQEESGDKDTKEYQNFIKYQKYRLNDYKKQYRKYIEEKCNDPEKDAPPKYAYIVFRRMKAMDSALKQYNLSALTKFFATTGDRFEGLRKKLESFLADEDSLKPKMMSEKHLIDVQNGGLPDEIMWMNIKYGLKNRRIRKLIIWIIALILILIAFAIMVWLKNIGEELKGVIQDESSICPSIRLEMKEQYIDSLEVKVIPTKDQLEKFLKKQAYEQYTNVNNGTILNCYCQSVSNENGTSGILKVSFKDIYSEEDSNLCTSWLIQQLQSQSMVIIFGIIINIINVGNCILFEIMQIFERNHSRNEATSAKFLKFFIMQYLVISVIILFVSFKAESYEDFKFMGFIPMFQGQYPDFTAMWFYDVGSTICLTLTMNIVSPHVSKISIVLLFLLVRCRDRHWKFSEKDPKFELEDEDQQKEGGEQYLNTGRSNRSEKDNLKIEIPKDDEETGVAPEFKKEIEQEKIKVTLYKNIKYMVVQPKLDQNIESDVNTRLSTQQNVEKLYTGIEMDSHFVYAQIITSFFSCMTFSSGLPLLYIVGFCFSTVLYWVYKIMLLKFYSKTTSFNQDLAVWAIDMLQVSVIFHILIGSFIYSNSAIFGRSEDIEENFFHIYIKDSYPGMEERFQSHHSIFYFGLSMLCLLLYISYYILMFVGSAMYSFYQQSKKGQGEELDSDGVEQVSDFYKDLTLQQLRQLNVRFNKELSSIKEFFGFIDDERSEEGRKKVDHYFSSAMRDRYLDWHLDRIEAIEQVIEFHFNEFIKAQKKLKKDMQLEKIRQEKSQKPMTGVEQQKFLQDQRDIESAIKKVRRCRKMDTDGQISTLISTMDVLEKKGLGWSSPDCFRLQDVTQSFYIYDKAEYRNARKMLDIIESEETQQLQVFRVNTFRHDHKQCDDIDYEALKCDDGHKPLNSPCLSHEDGVYQGGEVFKQAMIKLKAIKNFKSTIESLPQLQFSKSFKSRKTIKFEDEAMKQQKLIASEIEQIELTKIQKSKATMKNKKSINKKKFATQDIPVVKKLDK